jgi:DNA-binding response OmpR family regulator
MDMDRSNRILIIASEPRTIETIRQGLEAKGYATATTTTKAAAEHILEHEYFDLAIADMVLQDGSGLDLFKKMNRAGTPCLFVSSGSDHIQDLVVSGVDFLERPFGATELCGRVAQLLRRGKARSRSDRRRDSGGEAA